MKSKKEKSFNAIDIIHETFSSLRKKQTKAFLGSVFMLAVIMLVFGIMYGLSKSLIISGVAVAFVYGILITPFLNFMCNVADGRGALEDMFQKNQYTLSNILIGFVFAACVLFGSLLFIVPAFIFLTYFIFALPIASNTTSKCFDAFIKAKQLSKGYRGRILLVLLIFTAILLAFVGTGVGISALIFLLIFKMLGWWFIGVAVGLIGFIIFVMPYMALSIIYLYDNTIADKKDAQTKVNKTETKTYSFNSDLEAKEEIDEDEDFENNDTENVSTSSYKNPFDYSDIIKK